MNNNKIPVYLAILGGVILALIIAAVVVDQIQHAKTATTNINTPVVSTDANPPPGVKTGNRIGNLGPDFTLNTTTGSQIKLSDYRGKPVILNFWASWCGPCQFEMPFLKAIDEEWAKTGVTIIGVSTQDSPDNTISYVKAKGLKFTVPVDPQGKVANLYGIRGMPTTFFINEKGIITSIKVGPFVNTDDIETHMASFSQAP